MTQLSPCARCHRHLRVAEAECPFCGQTRKAGLGKSVALASALVGVAAMGCNERPKSKAPPPVEPAETPEAEVVAQPPVVYDAALPADASVADAQAPDATPAKKGKVKKSKAGKKKVDKEASPKKPPLPPMPYGAPPARKRLV